MPAWVRVSRQDGGGAAEGGMEREGSGRAAREVGPNRVGRSLGLEGGPGGGRGKTWGQPAAGRAVPGQGDQKDADSLAKLPGKLGETPGHRKGGEWGRAGCVAAGHEKGQAEGTAPRARLVNLSVNPCCKATTWYHVTEGPQFPHLWIPGPNTTGTGRVLGEGPPLR